MKTKIWIQHPSLKIMDVIHYDTKTNMGKTNNHTFFILLLRIVLFLLFIQRYLFDNYILNTSLYWHHLHDYSSQYKKPKNNCVAFTTLNNYCIQMTHARCGVHTVIYAWQCATTLHNCCTHYPSIVLNGWVELWPKPISFLLTF